MAKVISSIVTPPIPEKILTSHWSKSQVPTYLMANQHMAPTGHIDGDCDVGLQV